jgi:HPt (histidine-containing phosphotransfer) domain-containing protein
MSQLISIDMQIGLKYAGNNKDLYLKMVERFYNNYQEIDLDGMSSDEFKSEIHNLKTISMYIGAINLHNIAKDIDENGLIEELPNLVREIESVLTDIETLLNK